MLLYWEQETLKQFFEPLYTQKKSEALAWAKLSCCLAGGQAQDVLPRPGQAESCTSLR